MPWTCLCRDCNEREQGGTLASRKIPEKGAQGPRREEKRSLLQPPLSLAARQAPRTDSGAVSPRARSAD